MKTKPRAGNKRTKTLTAVSVGSDSLLAPLYAAAGQIVCRKYYCQCCAGRRDAALEKAKFGPAAFLHAVINHNGMSCGCAEWMIETAHDALGANDKDETRSPNHP